MAERLELLGTIDGQRVAHVAISNRSLGNGRCHCGQCRYIEAQASRPRPRSRTASVRPSRERIRLEGVASLCGPSNARAPPPPFPARDEEEDAVGVREHRRRHRHARDVRLEAGVQRRSRAARARAARARAGKSDAVWPSGPRPRRFSRSRTPSSAASYSRRGLLGVDLAADPVNGSRLRRPGCRGASASPWRSSSARRPAARSARRPTRPRRRSSPAAAAPPSRVRAPGVLPPDSAMCPPSRAASASSSPARRAAASASSRTISSTLTPGFCVSVHVRGGSLRPGLRRGARVDGGDADSRASPSACCTRARSTSPASASRRPRTRSTSRPTRSSRSARSPRRSPAPRRCGSSSAASSTSTCRSAPIFRAEAERRGRRGARDDAAPAHAHRRLDRRLLRRLRLRRRRARAHVRFARGAAAVDAARRGVVVQQRRLLPRRVA